MMSARGRRWAGLAIKAAITIGLAWLVLRGVDPGDTLDRLGGASLPLLAAATIPFVAHCVVAGWRWSIVAGLLDSRLPVAMAIRLFFEGLFFSNALPSTIGGDVVRVWRAAALGLKVEQAIGSVLLDRITRVTALYLFVVAGAPVLFNRLDDAAARFGLAVVLLGGVTGLGLLLAATSLPRRWRETRTIRPLAGLSAAARRAFFEPAVASRVMLPAFAIHLLILASVWLIGRSIGVNLGVFEMLVLMPVVLLLSAVPVSIGGWGVREGLMVTVLGLAGVPAEAALGLSVLFGLVQIASSLPGGILWLASGARRGAG